MTAVRAEPLAAPFRGLAPFGDSELDALLFFGRERETEIAVANLLAARLTILYGPSGVGKSSLLRAGVTRRVRELAGRRAIGRGPDGAVVVVSAWVDEPVGALAEAIGDEVTSLVKRPVARPEPGRPLADVVEHWTDVLDGHLYLVLDQLEEYFVYHDGEHGPGTLQAELPDVILRPRLRANVMLSLRDDALAQLDVFKARLPGLFANYLRLDRLDRASATAAIRGPIERWNGLVPAEQRVEIEPVLVEAVLDEAAPALEPELVEAPYLQLVLERLWNEERERGSSTLRASTLVELGGAGEIVREHLERALSVLDRGQQDAAARMFEHLVTPSGTKVAHSAGDLAEFANVPAAAATSMLAALGRERILRPLDDAGGTGDRYEIFHDVLGEAIVGWRRRHLLVRERVRAQKRQRRLAAVALASLVAVLVMVGITVYALSQRSHARHQARLALAATKAATAAEKQAGTSAARAERETTLAKSSLRKETAAESTAKRERNHATDLAGQLGARNVQLNAALQDAKAATAQAKHNLDVANAETGVAKRNLRFAHAAIEEQQRQTGIARRQTGVAERQTKIATAQKNLSLAEANLGVDPARSVAYALSAAATLPGPAVALLRDSLVRLHELRIVGSAAQRITAVALTSDGTRFAAARPDGAALYDAHTGRPLRSLQAPAGVQAIAVSPDGSLVAGGTRTGATLLWSAGTGNLLRTLPGERPVLAVAFSSDGRLLATGGLDQTAKVWDTTTGTLLDRFRHPRAVTSVTFDSDASELLTTEGDRFARVFPLGGAAAQSVLDQIGGVTSAEFSDDGSLIATTGRNDTATLWDARTGTRLHVFTGHASDVTTAAFSHDGTFLATASADDTARVWDTHSYNPVSTMSGDTGLIRSIAWSPDDRFVVTGSTDGSARVWEPSDGFSRLELLGHTGAVNRVAYAGADTVLTNGSDGTVRLWNAHDQPALRVLGVHKARVVAVAFALGGARVVSASTDGTAAIWPSSGRAKPIRLQHGGPVSGLAVGPDGSKVLTWSVDGTAALWDASNGRRLLTFTQGAPVVAAALSPDGAFAATAGNDNTVKVWDAVTGGLVRTVPQAGADAVAFSPAGRLLATGGSDRAVHIWRVPGGTSLESLPEPAAVSSLAFSPDGRTLAAAVVNVVTVWRTSDWRQSFTFSHANRIRSLAFSRGGGRLLSGSLDGTAQLWDVSTRRLVEELRGHFGPVNQAALSADGRWAVTAGPLTAGVWPTVEDTRLADNRLFFLRGNTMQVLSVAFAPTGWRIATGDADGSVRIYDCVLCGGLAQLEPLARRRLAALHSGD